MSAVREIERILARTERAMDEAYSRFARADESQRVDGVASALQRAIESVPADLQPVILELLGDRYEASGPRTDDTALAAELALLRAETERLRAERQATQGRQRPDAMVLQALLGADGMDAPGNGSADAEQVSAAVRELVVFSLDLARGFLGSVETANGASENAERWRRGLQAQLRGEPGEPLAALLEETKMSIVALLQGIPSACRDGAKQLLKELDPLLLEYQARDSGKQILGFQLSHFRDLWQAFQRRYAELFGDDDLYEAYFAGPLKKARFQLRTRSPHA